MKGGRALFDYTHAIVRSPGRSVAAGLRAGAGPDPDYPALLAEHEAYVAAFGALGLAVTELPALEDFPDSVFVEDPALVFGEGAILLRLAALSRADEPALLASELDGRFPRVLRMTGPGHADGGDVLVLADRVVIGLSGRTDRAGAEELAGLLARLGKRAEIAETPRGVLHFKTGCSLIDEDTVLALPQLVDAAVFAGMRVVPVPFGEEPAANALRIRGAMLIGTAFPRTREVIEACGVRTIALDVEQIGRIDAGLSCMSLRWRAAAD